MKILFLHGDWRILVKLELEYSVEGRCVHKISLFLDWKFNLFYYMLFYFFFLKQENAGI